MMILKKHLRWSGPRAPMKSLDSTRRIKSREIVKRKIEEIERRMSRSARKETASTERWRS